MAQCIAKTKAGPRCSLSVKSAGGEYCARHSAPAGAIPSSVRDSASDNRVAAIGSDPSREELRELIERTAMSAGAMGIPGAVSFGLDVTAVSALWITMTLSIAHRLGHKELGKDFVAKLVTAVLAGTGGYIAGSKLAISALNLIPLGGTLTAMGVNSVLNYIFTLRLGDALTQLFSTPHFDSGDLSAAVAHCLPIVKQFPKGRELAAFVDAFRRA